MIRLFKKLIAKKSTRLTENEKREIRDFIQQKYSLKLSRKKYSKYVYLYSKYAENEMTMYDATFEVAENIERFVYFIYGYNAYYKHKKKLKEKHFYNENMEKHQKITILGN
jgi:thiamine phosphate synthase YjbQ (UPF0047 family)